MFISLAFLIITNVQADELRFDPRISWPLISVTAIGVGALQIFEDRVAPKNCRWCETNAFDSSARNILRWSDTKTADNLSHVLGYGLSPIFALSTHAYLDWRDNDLDSFSTDALVISEATLTAALISKISQVSFGRERPSSRYATPHQNKNSENTSFISSHATISFALATSSAMVASLRNRSEAPYLWTGGLLIAATTSYLRIAADRHYLSDVLVGAAVGAGTGILVPLLLHSPGRHKRTTSADVMILPTPSQTIAQISLRW